MAPLTNPTAFIACSGDEERGVHWFGHVQSEGRVAEYGPDWLSPEEAMIWARERTSFIYIRLRVEGRYWWAGEGAPPPNGPHIEGTIAWRDAALPMPLDHVATAAADPTPISATVITRGPVSDHG